MNAPLPPATVRRRSTIQRRFWSPAYDRFAAAYDAVDWFTGNYTHVLRLRALDYLPLPPARVLEVGMGTGKLHGLLASRYDMAGMDFAPGMVQQTQRRLAELGRRSALTVGTVYGIPWPNATFDAVLSTFAFSAFVDAGSALDEMVRVTRPGGSVIIVDAGEAMDGNRMAHLLARCWEAMGDFMRDEVPLMMARGLAAQRVDYGPWDCVHVTVGVLPERESV
ncbi:MAG: class I SAM-dependent methyltransferase [Caldilineaceae bacterium]|jgi:ubiquinone/menaquinone biosynthesis C-methylase UbiE